MEKFVGDAVMAVFGAPVAHEDDPERAVREERDGIWREAGSLAARGEILAAADLLGRHGFRTEEAYVRLRAAETLTGAARSAQLESALAFYRSVGASAYVQRGEALLPATA